MKTCILFEKYMQLEIIYAIIQQVCHLGRRVDDKSNKNDIEGRFSSQKN